MVLLLGLRWILTGGFFTHLEIRDLAILGFAIMSYTLGLSGFGVAFFGLLGLEDILNKKIYNLSDTPPSGNLPAPAPGTAPAPAPLPPLVGDPVRHPVNINTDLAGLNAVRAGYRVGDSNSRAAKAVANHMEYLANHKPRPIVPTRAALGEPIYNWLSAWSLAENRSFNKVFNSPGISRGGQPTRKFKMYNSRVMRAQISRTG